MSDEMMLSMLKVDLGITTNAYDTRLSQYLSYAKKEIGGEGVTLTSSSDDSTLIIMYAAWLWRKRDTGEGMPRMIRWMLNNRIFKGQSNG